ncbi:MAG: hypothetical protein UHS51_09795 [Atopobiaceae bacterium]|jgi:hypothetical protein|nr:hypothetical protein [Atopobiaceae bacterium]
MENLIELVKLVTALLALITAIVKLLSEAGGSHDRRDEEESR